MKYQPDSPDHRRALAGAILAMLGRAGFEEQPGRGERVFARDVRDGMRVLVWTSIVGDSIRPLAEDAIRIAGVYHARDNHERGVVKNARVNRVGEVEAIVERVHERMRETWKRCANVERCSRCRAPMFVTKKSKLACAELCWKER